MQSTSATTAVSPASTDNRSAHHVASSLSPSSPAAAVARRRVALSWRDRCFLDHWLQDRDLSRETAGHRLRELPVKPAKPLGLEQMTPRDGPSFQLDLRSQEMLDFDDSLIKKREVRHRAGRSVLEVQSDLDPSSRAIGPDLVVNSVITIVELEQHRVRAMSEPRQFRRQVRPRISHDRRQE